MTEIDILVALFKKYNPAISETVKGNAIILGNVSESVLEEIEVFALTDALNFTLSVINFYVSTQANPTVPLSLPGMPDILTQLFHSEYANAILTQDKSIKPLIGKDINKLIDLIADVTPYINNTTGLVKTYTIEFLIKYLNSTPNTSANWFSTSNVSGTAGGETLVNGSGDRRVVVNGRPYGGFQNAVNGLHWGVGDGYSGGAAGF